MRMLIIGFSVVVLAVFTAGSAAGDTFTFDVTDGSWGVPGNWDPPIGAPPEAGDIAVIPAGKTCRIDTANQAVAVLDIVGTLKIIGQRDLVMDQAGLGASTVDGQLIFETGGGPTANPRILVFSDLVFNGTGEIFGDDSANNDPNTNFGGYFWSSASTPPSLTIGAGLTARGSISFMVSLTNNGTVKVDDPNDFLWTGFSGFGVGTLSGTGDFLLSAGGMALDSAYDPAGTWDMIVSGGTLTVVYAIPCHNNVPGTFTFTGGTFDVDADFCGTGGFSLNNCTIDVDIAERLLFASTCPPCP